MRAFGSQSQNWGNVIIYTTYVSREKLKHFKVFVAGHLSFYSVTCAFKRFKINWAKDLSPLLHHHILFMQLLYNSDLFMVAFPMLFACCFARLNSILKRMLQFCSR